MKINTPSTHKSGFTVVELLVAMTITITIVGMLVFVARTAFSSLSDGTNNISARQSAQTVLEQITSDFESMEYRNDSHQWLEAEGINTLTTHDSAGANNYNNDDIFNEVVTQANTPAHFTRLAFFTKPRDRYNGVLTAPGDIACVEYGIGYKDPIAGAAGTNPTFVLYRQLINPDYTFENLLQQMDDNGTPTDKSDDTPEDLLSLIDSNRSSSTTSPNVFKEPTFLDDPSYLLCENIKEFSLTFHVQYLDDDKGNDDPADDDVFITKVPVIEIDNSGTAKNKVEKFALNGTTFNVTKGVSTTNSTFDDMVASGGNIVGVDVNIQVLNEDGVALMNAGAPADEVEKHVERFTRTINLPLLYGNSL